MSGSFMVNYMKAMSTGRLNVEAIRKTINEMKDSPLEDERSGPMASWAHAMRYKHLPAYGVSIAWPMDCQCLETALLHYSDDGRSQLTYVNEVGYDDIRRWDTPAKLIDHVTNELPAKLAAYLEKQKKKAVEKK